MEEHRNAHTLFFTGPRMPRHHCVVVSFIGALSVCSGLRMGSPALYSVGHMVIRFTQPQAFDRSVNIIFALVVPAWVDCSILLCHLSSEAHFRTQIGY